MKLLDEKGEKRLSNKGASKDLSDRRTDMPSMPSIRLGIDFWRTACQWRRSIEDSLDELGITHPQFMVLYHLECNSKASPNQKTLADIIGIDVATFSQIVRILERKNLVKRRHIKDDERAKYLKLTSLGGEALKRAMVKYRLVNHSFFDFHHKDLLNLVNSFK